MYSLYHVVSLDIVSNFMGPIYNPMMFLNLFGLIDRSDFLIGFQNTEKFNHNS